MTEPVPGYDQAIVEPAKVANYLLSTTNPVGRGKAQFFLRFGFREDAPEELVQALLEHVHDNPVADVAVSTYGTKYRVDGPIGLRLAVSGLGPFGEALRISKRGSWR